MSRKLGCQPVSLGYDRDVPICSPAQQRTIEEILSTSGDCKVPCRGIFADVKRYDLGKGLPSLIKQFSLINYDS